MNFNKILTEAQTRHQVVSVFTNEDDIYKASVGFVAAVDDEYLILFHITEDGEYDGYVLKRMANIFRIDADCEYERRCQRLYGLKKQHHDSLLQSSDSLIIDFFDWANQSGFVVGVGIRDTGSISVRGLVETIDTQGKLLMLREVTNNGERTGIISFEFSAVERACCDTQEDHNLKLLAAETSK